MASASLIITRIPLACARSSASPAERSMRFHVDGTEVKTSSSRARSIAAAWSAPLVDRPTSTPPSRSSPSAASSGPSSKTPLSIVAEWIW